MKKSIKIFGMVVVLMLVMTLFPNVSAGVEPCPDADDLDDFFDPDFGRSPNPYHGLPEIHPYCPGYPIPSGFTSGDPHVVLVIMDWIDEFTIELILYWSDGTITKVYISFDLDDWVPVEIWGETLAKMWK